MLKRINSILLLLLAAATSLGQSLQRYEYWMDSEYGKHTTVRTSETDIKFDVDLSRLGKGVHYLNFRAQNSDKVWGAPQRYLFFVPDVPTTAPKVSSYEYWLDGETNKRTAVRQLAEDIALTIDISKLDIGVHYFNFRVIDSNGSRSSLNRYLFFLPQPQGGGITLNQCEYWIDEGKANRKQVNGYDIDEAISVDISSLAPGVHYFNFRANSTGRVWGSLSRYLFYIPEYDNTSDAAVCYEYWLDTDYSKKQTQKANSSEIPLTVDVSQMEKGMHYFNLRGQNAKGEWGALSRWVFFLPYEDEKTSGVANYQYWIDDAYSEKRTVNATAEDVMLAVDVSKLKGSHIFNFRVQNGNGDWGSIFRYVFFVPEASEVDTKVVNYQYWIDNELNAKQTVEAVADNVDLSIDVSHLKGIHYLNFRGQSKDGTWGALSRYLFYVPTEVTEQNQLLTGYRYTFNGHTTFTSIAACKEYELSAFTVSVPDLKEIGSLTDGCSWQFSDTAAMLTRNQKVSFAIQFQNIAGDWSKPVTTEFESNDELTRELSELSLKRQLTVDKVSKGDFQAFRMAIDENRNYFLSASQPCCVMFFDTNGNLVTTIDGDKLDSVYQTSFDSGTYYGVVYDMKDDSINADKQITMRLSLTERIVPTPKIAWQNETVTIDCEQEGAAIYYSLDGSDPTPQSTRYTAPFSLKQNATVKAIAVEVGSEATSYTAELTVDSYQVEKPTIEFADLKVYINCATPDARIYYTLDSSIPTEKSLLYTAPFSQHSNCIIRAVARRNGYHDSEETSLVIDVSKLTCTPALFSVVAQKVSITTLTNETQIYYTLDGTIPTAQSMLYEGPFVPLHNGTLRAIVTKNGYVDSEVTAFTVDWVKVETPVLSYTDGVLTMSCTTPGATIYYVVGDGTPLLPYSQPITLTDNRTVTAVAKAQNLLDSEMATYNPNTFTCESVTVSFNGRDLQLRCATDGASIRYTTDGTQPGGSSPLYTGQLTIGDLVTVKAIAMKPNTNSSALTTYVVPAYYDGKVAGVGMPGQLSQAFGWCTKEAIEALVVKGLLNEADLKTLQSMKQLRHLDMSQVTMTDYRLPEKAFQGMSLVSVIAPESVTSAGSSLFEGCQQLAAITWLPDFKLTEQMLQGVDNPNLLVYVNLLSDVATMVCNVVVNGHANRITLTDRTEGNANFYCPTAFTANSISYTHSYQQQTGFGECRGWETLALPFKVQTISHQSQGLLAPFAQGNTEAKPFWLCRLDVSGFERTDVIEANTPYIISMPNNQSYADQYILGGQVTFEAQNATVYASEELVTAEKSEFMFVPTFTSVVKTDGVLPLNVGQAFDGLPEGSNFFRDLNREVRPFEAYIVSRSRSARRFAIEEETLGIEDFQLEMMGSVRVFDLRGLLVGTAKNLDELRQSHRLRPGVYLVRAAGGKLQKMQLK